MEKTKLAQTLEHTVLKPDALISAEFLEKELKFVSENGIGKIVLPPYHVKKAAEINEKFGTKVIICTVIGFPLGYNTLETKVFEMKEAIKFGAKEIDLVLNNNLVAEGDYAEILREFKTFRKEAGDDIALKMILETSLLDEERILKVTELLVEAKFDFVKTSTGFIGEGAQLAHVKAIKAKFKDSIKIKASGGIRDRETALAFLEAGTATIGTSSAAAILNPDDKNVAKSDY